MEFDEYQKKVITAKGGHYLVLAPPGCGKTELLTQRILNANNNGVSFDDMLCLTFTNRAARSMRERIAATTNSPCDGLFVGNIHRFCSRFLFENNLIPASTSIIDELDQKDILDEFGFTKHNETCASREDQLYVSDVCRLSSLMYQHENSHPSGVRLSAPVFKSKTASQVSQYIAEQYYIYKKEHNLIDFDDILLLSFTFLCREDSKALKYSDYHWIQVDEVQDLNALQLAIIDRLTSLSGYTVMYLGDEQQAIYSFMGAKMGNLYNIVDKAGTGHILRLYKNYRSPKYLVDSLNTYAIKNLKLDDRLLPSATGNETQEKGCLNIFEYTSEIEQMSDIRRILEHVVNQHPDERVGVLTRTNKEADDISNQLSVSGIHHFKLSGQDVFKSDDFKTILSHFSVIQRETNYFDWARLIWKTKASFSFKDARDIVSRLRRIGVSPLDLMYEEYGRCYIDDFLRVYQEKEFVIFDTETTGLNTAEDDIIQLAAIKVRGGKVIPGSELDMVIRTDRIIPPMLGDIENPMVSVYKERMDAGQILEPKEALASFLSYVGEDDVLGHNVEFDLEILRQNLLRRCGGIKLHEHITRRWDSLRLIHLLQPRLRVYKLKALLAQFGLEGANSHKADDDIIATKSLVDYCAELITSTSKQREAFWRDVNIQRVSETLRKNYAPFHNATRQLMSFNATGVRNVFLREFQSIYEYFLEAGFINEIPAFEHIVDFLRSAVFNQDIDSSLRAQLEQHLKDLKTFSQSDLCDSGIITDKVFVMTVHKAKGLEFEHVVLPNSFNGMYPFFLSKTENDIIEDARLYYVGLSRSKKRISVLYPKSYKGFPKALTPFIECVKDVFLVYQRGAKPR